MATHRERIVEQFTHQAVPFSNAPGIKDEHALAQLVELSETRADDSVLDVACGPGLVVAAFARTARHVTGIDVTAAMLERARALTADYANVRFDQGDASPLPYADASFTLVVSRFAFHHFEDPAAALAEMRRVCHPGGRIVVRDLLAADDPRKAAAFHRVEKLRDPSHVRLLTLSELSQLFAAAGLGEPAVQHSESRFELEGMLGRSFPRAEDLPLIRAAYLAAIEDDGLGLGLHRAGDEVRGAYRVATLVVRTPAA